MPGSFEDVRELDEPELRALLDGGRPEERVWAIWALALRSGGTDVGELAARAEPDAGVRRNLAVVLAGHGHLELLVALAHKDPAPEVRGAAMALVSRLATDGKLPPTLVEDRALTDAPEVRIAVLGTIFATAPGWLADLAERLLDDRDPDVRYEAFEALVRANRLDVSLLWLEEIPEPEARLTLMRWSARGRTRACAEALSRASRRLRRMLIESVRVAAYDDLAPAVADDPALVRALARRNAHAFEQLPLATLIRATLREPSDPWILIIRDRLTSLDAPSDFATLLPDYRELCARRLAELTTQMHSLRKVGSEAAAAELSALDEERAALESALDAAARLLLH